MALASAISQCVSAALILRALTRAQDCYALDVHQLHLDPATTKSILALGVPAGFQNAIFAIANLFIQAGVNSFDSLMVKGNSAAANADNMIYDCMAAFYMACASFMSQNYGAGKPDRVKKSYFISLGYSFGVGLALGSALFFFGRTFLALFTTESAVIDAGMKRVAVMAFATASRLYGLHHRRLPRAGQDRGAHHHCGDGLLRVPCDLGVHHLCPLPHHPGAVPAVPLQLDPDRLCRDPVLCALLQAVHGSLQRAAGGLTASNAERPV